MSGFTQLALVADDNVINRRIGSLLCRNAGYETLEVDSAASALQAVGQAHFSFALIDLHMPKISGQELCRLLRSDFRLQAMKMIAYTGRLSSQDKSDLEGFDAVLRKPADLLSFKMALLRAGVLPPAVAG